MLTNILPQYLKNIMGKLPEFFRSKCRDVNLMVCHTLTFLKKKLCLFDPKLQENVFFSCFVMFMYYDVNKTHSFIHLVISH